VPRASCRGVRLAHGQRARRREPDSVVVATPGWSAGVAEVCDGGRPNTSTRTALPQAEFPCAMLSKSLEKITTGLALQMVIRLVLAQLHDENRASSKVK
jgi:hypothetical protein